MDRLHKIDGRILSISIATMAAVSPILPRATVPILFVLFIYQVVQAVRQRALPSIKLPLAAGIVALVLWSYLSALWALAPTASATTRLLPLFIAGLCAAAWAGQRGGDRASVYDLAIGIAIAAVVYVFEGISWGWLTRLAHQLEWRDILDETVGGVAVMALLINGTVILTLLMWPAATGLLAYGRRWEVVALVAAIVVMSISFGSESGLIAIVLGWLVWWMVSLGGAKAMKALALVFAVVVMATPSVVSRVLTDQTIDRVIAEVPNAPHSALARLMIWKFTSEKIAERPLIGWGFDAARRIPGGGDRFVLKDASGRILTAELNLPLHPHNQILQIWLELGAVGALIVALSGAVLIVQGARLPARARNGSAALIVSFLVFACLSYGAWQSWWIAAIALAATAQASMNRLAPRPD